MRVPLLDLADEYRTLRAPIRAAIDHVLETQQFILGPEVAALEKEIAQYCGAAHAIGVSSGTDALLAVFMALGYGPGDAIITTPYTFFASAACIARVGATPIFVDIDPATFNLSPEALATFLKTQCRRDRSGAVIDAHGRKVRAVVPVHLFGLCGEMDPLRDLAAEFRLTVIEDAAQAIGAEYPSRNGAAKAGTMSAAGTFSFYPSKNLGAAGDAGLVVTNDDAVAHQLRVCRQHGMEDRYFHQTIGGNFRLDELQAAVLRVKLPSLDQWSAARRRVADEYRAQFSARGLTSVFTLPSEPFRASGLTNHHIYHQFVIRTARRDALRAWLTEKQIGSAIYYPLGLHQQVCFSGLGYGEGDFPETERACRETLALPIYPALSREQQAYVIESIDEFFCRNPR